MSIIDGFLAELEHEAASTKKMLKRVPEEHWDWKPHEKSMSLGALASHVAESPQWIGAILDTEAFNLDMDSYKPYMAASVPTMLETFDKDIATAREKMQGTSDEAMMVMWSMSVNGKQILEMPRVAAVRAFIFSHLIHHRGQLSVYLRLKDVPLPAIYGGSADEEE